MSSKTPSYSTEQRETPGFSTMSECFICMVVRQLHDKCFFSQTEIIMTGDRLHGHLSNKTRTLDILLIISETFGSM